MKKIELVNKNKHYSLLTIYKMNWFNWITSYDSLRRLVKRDIKENKNKTFNVIVYGKKQGKRYLIKGNVILKLNNKIKKGFIFNNIH